MQQAARRKTVRQIDCLTSSITGSFLFCVINKQSHRKVLVQVTVSTVCTLSCLTQGNLDLDSLFFSGATIYEKKSEFFKWWKCDSQFFQMKELEKIAPKQKGIVSQSVKEITQLLVDEGLVECEKIGTFVCYWAFPSQAAIIVSIIYFFTIRICWLLSQPKYLSDFVIPLGFCNAGTRVFSHCYRNQLIYKWQFIWPAAWVAV